MVTKHNDPCREKAKDDEPLFTLLARDPDASVLVALWGHMRQVRGETANALEAMQIASEMQAWRERKYEEAGVPLSDEEKSLRRAFPIPEDKEPVDLSDLHRE
jgi:hypothetical protein